MHRALGGEFVVAGVRETLGPVEVVLAVDAGEAGGDLDLARHGYPVCQGFVFAAGVAADGGMNLYLRRRSVERGC